MNLAVANIRTNVETKVIIQINTKKIEKVTVMTPTTLEILLTYYLILII